MAIKETRQMKATRSRISLLRRLLKHTHQKMLGLNKWSTKTVANDDNNLLYILSLIYGYTSEDKYL